MNQLDSIAENSKTRIVDGIKQIDRIDKDVALLLQKIDACRKDKNRIMKELTEFLPVLGNSIVIRIPRLGTKQLTRTSQSIEIRDIKIL